MTADAYNINLIDGSSYGGGTYSVIIGFGDPDAEAYTGSNADVLEWTTVVPVGGTIELRGESADGNNWRNTALCFVSLTSTNADPNANYRPIADAISTNVNEDTNLDITLSGSDPEGSNLTYNVVSSPANGTWTTNGALPNLTYMPNTNFYGLDSFTYTVNDGVYDSVPATVSITVHPIGDDPPVADNLAVLVYEGYSIKITLSGTDPDGVTNLTYTVFDPSHGELSGIAPDLTYTPDAGYLGDDSFTYTVNDGDFDSEEATVSIMVSLTVPAGTALILNSDFETNDGVLEGGGSFSSFDNWIGSGDGQSPKLRYDIGNDGNIPGGNGNTLIRIVNGKTMYQNFNTSWGSNNTFTVTLNACEVWWKAATNQLGNGFYVSLRSASGTEYQEHLIDLDSTHGGQAATYESWETNQTHSLEFTGAALIAAGATANEELRLNIFSKSGTHSINWIDNASLIMGWGALPTSVGNISIEVVQGGTNVALSWLTREGWNYGVEAKESGLKYGSWSTIITGVEGTGAEVTVTNPVSSYPKFYRAYLETNSVEFLTQQQKEKNTD